MPSILGVMKTPKTKKEPNGIKNTSGLCVNSDTVIAYRKSRNCMLLLYNTF